MASLSEQTFVQTLYKCDEIALFLKQLVFGWWKIDLQVSAKWTTISRSSTEESDAVCVVELKKEPILWDLNKKANRWIQKRTTRNWIN